MRLEIAERLQSKSEEPKAVALRSGLLALRYENRGRSLNVGLLSPTRQSNVAVPAAVCGVQRAPNRVVLVSAEDEKNAQRHLGAAERIADNMKDQGVCVVVVISPVREDDVATLAAVVLSDNPDRVILLDPDDTMDEDQRRAFLQRAGARNAALTAEGAGSIDVGVMGKAELEAHHDDGPRTVRTAIDALTERMSSRPDPAASKPSQQTPKTRSALDPGTPASRIGPTQLGGRRRPGSSGPAT